MTCLLKCVFYPTPKSAPATRPQSRTRAESGKKESPSVCFHFQRRENKAALCLLISNHPPPTTTKSPLCSLESHVVLAVAPSVDFPVSRGPKTVPTRCLAILGQEGCDGPCREGRVWTLAVALLTVNPMLTDRLYTYKIRCLQ